MSDRELLSSKEQLLAPYEAIQDVKQKVAKRMERVNELLSSNQGTIPLWNDIAAKDNRGEPLTALEQFVYDNEPAPEEDEAIFRSGLLAVLREARAADEPTSPRAALHAVARKIAKTSVAYDERSACKLIDEALATAPPPSACPECEKLREQIRKMMAENPDWHLNVRAAVTKPAAPKVQLVRSHLPSCACVQGEGFNKCTCGADETSSDRS